jgi:ABC-2 type transport system ATP-binding protein
MRELLKELRRMGKTILISSHILPELADLCNSIGIIERGELLFSGPVAEILRRASTGTVLQVAVDGNSQQAAALLSQHADVLNVAANNGQLQVSLRQGVTDWSFVPQQLVQAGFRLTMLKEEEVNLETAFMRLTKGQVQ